MSPFADLYACHSIVHGSEYVTNACGIRFFTHVWDQQQVGEYQHGGWCPLRDRSLTGRSRRKLALASPRRTVVRLRATTALELLRICRELQGRFKEVEVPLVIVHGAEDVVCDPARAEELYHWAQSEDKMMKVYPEMWHQLIGKPEESIELGFGDMKDLLLTRARV